MDTTTKAVLWINAVAIALLIIEAMMGPTILGNVIFLALAALIGSCAVLIALIHLVTTRSVKATALLVASLAVVAYPVLRFASDTVPAGYGP